MTAVLLFSLAIAASRQADPAAAFRAKVDAAVQQMEADLPGAIEALDHLAVDSMELRKTRTLTAAERPVHTRLFLLRARGHIQLLNNDKAEDSVRELLRVDLLFPGELAPRELELFDRLRQREGGVIEVGSREPGARVLVDGVHIGTISDAPLRTPVVAGTYEVRLEKTGFKPAATRVLVAAGQTLSLTDLVLQRNVPPVAFLADREDVDVVADNVSVGRTMKLPELRRQVSPEESAGIDRALTRSGLDAQSAAGILVRQPAVDRNVTVRFHRNCFIEETRTISITSDMLAKLDPEEPVIWMGDTAALRMRPDTGTLRVTSTPPDADVYLDGQLAGRTPFDRQVCAGGRRVRVRHRIGSFNAAVTITRGRTEVIDIPLKPDLAFLGAVDTVEDALNPSQELTSLVDRALASTVTSFHLATRLDLPPEMPRWTDRSNAELVAASDKTDVEALGRLLKLAASNYEAPLLVCAVRRRAEAGGEAPLDLLLYWTEHATVDRLRVPGVSERAVAGALAALNAPGDGAALVYRNDLGIRAADTALPGAPLIVAAVVAGSPAAAAGVKPGDTIEAVDRSAVTAVQLAERVQQKQPGDVLMLRIASSGAPARDVTMPVQRRPYRAPAFDTAFSGNTLIAKLNAGAHTTSGADRELLTFSLALVWMRFGEWRRALDLLTPIGNLPKGDSVGRGAALFFRARCHEELGERDQAMALYKDAAAINDEALAEDGASVGAVARYRLAALSAAR